MNIEKELLKIVQKDRILKNEPMKKHTSFKVGGIADYFVIIENEKELKEILKFTKQNKIPLQLVGNGTNLLVTDKGIRGIVIKLNMQNYKIERTKNYALITVEAGFPLCKLANVALREELGNLEFLSGIPGTIGGAIRMNAGAYGMEMKDLVIKTKFMNEEGDIQKINLEEHEFSYRESRFSKEEAFILETTLRVPYDTKENIQKKIEEYSNSRKEKQPLEFPSAGSTFKRKEGIITAKLIDECGLKGYSIGDAEVSNKHAGFIVNKGNATAKDILDLIEYVKKVVYDKTKEKIELEVLVIGEK